MVRENKPASEAELILLGSAIYVAQKVEFLMYGIASHTTEIPSAKKDHRFRNLTPEKFLRGDTTELKATLGQLYKIFGEDFLLSETRFQNFIDDRNTIMHNYFRLYHAGIKNSKKRSDPVSFLKNFVDQGLELQAALEGFLSCIRYTVAQKESRLDEISFSKEDMTNIATYKKHVGRYLMNKKLGTVPDK